MQHKRTNGATKRCGVFVFDVSVVVPSAKSARRGDSGVARANGDRRNLTCSGAMIGIWEGRGGEGRGGEGPSKSQWLTLTPPVRITCTQSAKMWNARRPFAWAGLRETQTPSS